MKLIVGIDTRGDIRAHAASDVEGKAVCGVRPHLTQEQSDSDQLCCARCRRILDAKGGA